MNDKKSHCDFLIMIGKEVRELRKSKRMKINQIIEHVALSRNAYSQIENGKTNFNISALLRVLDFHKIEYLDFFTNIKSH